MASSKIKKKSGNSTPASMMPRQGAIPCLILIAMILLAVAVLGYFAFRSAG